MCVTNRANIKRRNLAKVLPISISKIISIEINEKGSEIPSEFLAYKPQRRQFENVCCSGSSEPSCSDKKTNHDYHDHAEDIPNGKKYVTKGGVKFPFPMKLYAALEQIEKDGLGCVISWQPHGRCFVVHNHGKFVEELLPKYFNLTKFSSFQRQLNLYGFSRLTKGLDKGGYYHELFLKGKEFLCRGMRRMRVKGTGVRLASNPEKEPNFYQMPFVGIHDKESFQCEFSHQADVDHNNEKNDSTTSNNDHNCDVLIFEGKKFHYLSPITPSSTVSGCFTHSPLKRNVLEDAIDGKSILSSPYTAPTIVSDDEDEMKKSEKRELAVMGAFFHDFLEFPMKFSQREMQALNDELSLTIADCRLSRETAFC